MHHSLGKHGRIQSARSLLAASALLMMLSFPGHLHAGLPATQPSNDPLRTPLVFQNAIEEKVLFLLPVIEQMPKVRQLLLDDASLQHIAASRRAALLAVAKAKADHANEVLEPARWSDSDIQETEKAFRILFARHPDARSAVSDRLRQSGMFVREQSLSDDDLIAYAWKQAALGINHILDVYGSGKKPQYPQIDSISFDPTSTGWAGRISEMADKALAAKPSDQDLLWGISARFALDLLTANDRDEAGRFEPMCSGENKAALARIPQMDWEKYPYTCIVVPGIGPDTPEVPLSSGGRANCQLAAIEFKARKAPFILLSGGYVHPNKTKYCEAVEMRRELIDKLGIPADAIIIDPHARHTTTNIRNAGRLVYRYGFPFDSPALVTSNASQIATVVSQGFARRCNRELGYEPCRIGDRVSPNELVIWFKKDALEADSLSPLDP
jgi:hypothetical protein